MMKQVFRFLPIVLFLFVSAGSAIGHGNLIRGKVTDSLTGEFLAGASITLNDNLAQTSTDQLGNFKFDNLDDGTYQLKVTFIGYTSYELVVTVKGDETKAVQIKLHPSSLKLDEITIIGSRNQEQTMATISKIDIALRPLKSSQDILRMIPGLVTAQHAGGGKAEQIFLRGFDADHGTDVSLSVDGMPVNMVSHAHGQGYADLHFVIPELVDFVDFNKGPYYSNVGDFNTA